MRDQSKVERMMVNSSENVETAKEAYTSSMSNTEGEGADLDRSGGGRVQRPRRIVPRRNSSAETSTKPSIFPIVQCKLPLDRISDILSKIRKTKMINLANKNKSTTDTNPSASDNISVLCVKMDQPPNPEHVAEQSDVEPRAERLSNSPARTMCLFCDRTFVNGILLQKHTERIHHISTNRRSSMRNAEVIFPPNFHPGCNMCNKNNGVQTATNLPVLFNHLLDEHSVKYFACRLCQERFSTLKILLCHNRNVHGQESERNLDDQHDQMNSKCLRKGVSAKEDSYLYENLLVNKCVLQTTSSSPISSDTSQNLLNTQSECSDNDLLSDISKKILPTTKMKDFHTSGVSLSESIHSKKKLKGKSLERKATRNSKNHSIASRNSKVSNIASRNSKYPCIELRNSKAPCIEPNSNLIHLYAKSFEAKTIAKKRIDSAKTEKSVKDTSSTNDDFIDFEDNIVANLIIPSERVQISKKNGLDQSAVIILDDINLDKSLFKLKDSISPISRAPLKPDANDNQILSRLGVTQNRSPRARSLRRSQKAPITENRASSEISRKDKSKVKNDPADFVINKSRNDPNSKFDPDFYSNVGNNVRENLMKFLDGKLGMQNVACDVPEIIDPKIRSTHAIIPAVPIQPAEIHGSDISLNAITVFPTLLTSDQYGSDKVPHYSYGAKVQTFKKIVTKNSWKWKWDPIKKYKYCNEDGKIVRKIRQLQQISPRDLSKLDIWTQLSMREKYDTYIVNKESISIDNDEENSRCERQRQINELNTILDKRVFPEIEDECLRYKSITNFSSVESITTDVPQSSQSVSQNKVTKKNSVSLEEPSNDENILGCLGLVPRCKIAAEAQSSEVLPVLSGEWARPRCYVCCVCGRRTDCLRLLEAHQATRHPHVHATHYELVGQELLQKELYKHLYLPGMKRDHQAIEKNKLRKESIARQIKKIPRRIINRSTRILRTTTRKIKSSERECTKCKKLLTPGELYRHVLECAGDYGWIMAKKKCKYKPFGARKRRLKGLYKRERPQEDDNGELKDRTARPKIPSRPRIKPSDAETIQRMLANLPAKRASRQILDLPSPKIRNHLKNDNQTHIIRRVLPSTKANLQRQQVLSTTVITTLKSGLGKKVRRITRSVANNIQALRQRKFLMTAKKEVQPNENSNSPKRILHSKTEPQTPEKDISKDVAAKNVSVPKSPSKVISKRRMSQIINKEKEPPPNSQVNQEKLSIQEKYTRNRSRISKNEILSAHKDLSLNEKLKKKTRTLRRRPDATNDTIEPTLKSSEIVKKTDSSIKKTIKKLNSKIIKPNQNADENLLEIESIESLVNSGVKQSNSELVSEDLISNTEVDKKGSDQLPKPKSKKSRKKVIGFPLKWISSKKMRLVKSKNKLKKNENDQTNTDLLETNTDITSSEIETVKSSLTSNAETIEISETQSAETKDLPNPNLQVDTETVEESFQKTSAVDKNIDLNVTNSKTIAESSSPLQNINPLSNIENLPILAQIEEVPISEASYKNVTSGNFPLFYVNNSQSTNSGSNDNHKQSHQMWKSNTTQFLKDLDTDILNMSKNNSIGGSMSYLQLENTVIPNSVIEPSRMLNNEYHTVNDKIDKPPLYSTQSYRSTYKAECSKSLQLENVTNIRHGIISNFDNISDEIRSVTKLKQPKSKRGLNDCIAMLKGKLTEKVIPPEPQPTFDSALSTETNFTLNEEDSQQPLDLSGRIPQAEDLSLKTTTRLSFHQKYSEDKCGSSISFTKSTVSVKSTKKPVFDPTLRIPQYSVNHMNKSNNVSVQKISGVPPNVESNRKIVQDFSIPSLLMPDRKRFPDTLPDNSLKSIDLPQIKYGLSLLQPTLVDTIEKLSPDQREEIVKALPQVFARAVENIQSKRTETSANILPLNFENKQDRSLVNLSDKHNLKTRPVSPQKMSIDFNMKGLTPQTSEISTQTVILNKENAAEKCPIEYVNVNTELFLIDPVTGMITERPVVELQTCNSVVSADDNDVILMVDEDDTCKSDSLPASSAEVIDLTEELSNTAVKSFTNSPTKIDNKTIPNESTIKMKTDLSNILQKETLTEKSLSESSKIESGTSSLRAVRIKSSSGKRSIFDLPQSEDAVLIDLSENQEEEISIVDLPTSNLKSHAEDNTDRLTELIHLPSFVESTTPSKDMCNESAIIEQLDNNLLIVHIENQEKEPAIQQDEVSSTQHSTVDESSDCQLIDTKICRDNDLVTFESSIKEVLKSHEKPIESGERLINEVDVRNPSIENPLTLPKRILRNTYKSELVVAKADEKDIEKVLESVLPSKKRVVTPKKVKPSPIKLSAFNAPLSDNTDETTCGSDSVAQNKEKSITTNNDVPYNEPVKKIEMSSISENVQKVSFNKLLMEENNTISETALTPSNVTEFQSDTKSLGKNEKSEIRDISKVDLGVKIETNVRRSLRKSKNKSHIKDSNKHADKSIVNLQSSESCHDMYLNPDVSGSAIIPGESCKANLGKLDLSNSSNESNVLQVIETTETIISSANEESDDDICLAVVAKKKLTTKVFVDSDDLPLSMEITSILPAQKIMIANSNKITTEQIENISCQVESQKMTDLSPEKIQPKKVSETPKAESTVLISPSRLTRAQNSKQEKKFISDLPITEDILPSEEMPATVCVESIDTPIDNVVNTSSFPLKKRRVLPAFVPLSLDDINTKKSENTRKSGRLSVYKERFSHISDDKIASINSVQLSDNGHLIFKLQKENDQSNENNDKTTILSTQKSIICTKSSSAKNDSKRLEKNKKSTKNKHLLPAVIINSQIDCSLPLDTTDQTSESTSQEICCDNLDEAETAILTTNKRVKNTKLIDKTMDKKTSSPIKENIKFSNLKIIAYPAEDSQEVSINTTEVNDLVARDKTKLSSLDTTTVKKQEDSIFVAKKTRSSRHMSPGKLSESDSYLSIKINKKLSKNSIEGEEILILKNTLPLNETQETKDMDECSSKVDDTLLSSESLLDSSILSENELTEKSTNLLFQNDTPQKKNRKQVKLSVSYDTDNENLSAKKLRNDTKLMENRQHKKRSLRNSGRHINTNVDTKEVPSETEESSNNNIQENIPLSEFSKICRLQKKQTEDKSNDPSQSNESTPDKDPSYDDESHSKKKSNKKGKSRHIPEIDSDKFLTLNLSNLVNESESRTFLSTDTSLDESTIQDTDLLDIEQCENLELKKLNKVLKKNKSQNSKTKLSGDFDSNILSEEHQADEIRVSRRGNKKSCKSITALNESNISSENTFDQEEQLEPEKVLVSQSVVEDDISTNNETKLVKCKEASKHKIKSSLKYSLTDEKICEIGSVSEPFKAVINENEIQTRNKHDKTKSRPKKVPPININKVLIEPVLLELPSLIGEILSNKSECNNQKIAISNELKIDTINKIQSLELKSTEDSHSEEISLSIVSSRMRSNKGKKKSKKDRHKRSTNSLLEYDTVPESLSSEICENIFTCQSSVAQNLPLYNKINPEIESPSKNICEPESVPEQELVSESDVVSNISKSNIIVKSKKKLKINKSLIILDSSLNVDNKSIDDSKTTIKSITPSKNCHVELILMKGDPRNDDILNNSVKRKEDCKLNAIQEDSNHRHLSVEETDDDKYQSSVDTHAEYSNHTTPINDSNTENNPDNTIASIEKPDKKSIVSNDKPTLKADLIKLTRLHDPDQPCFSIIELNSATSTNIQKSEKSGNAKHESKKISFNISLNQKDSSPKKTEDIKKSVDFSENTDIKKLPVQARRISHRRRTLASCEYIENTDKANDEDSILQDKYLADFGMFTEKRPRKSTIMAIKKISQTFKPDSSDTDDLDVQSSLSFLRRSSRPQKKRLRKSSLSHDDISSDKSITKESSNVSILSSDVIENDMHTPKTDHLSLENYDGYISPNQLDVSKEMKFDTYCTICKRKFRRPENLLKHKMTLMHISKLSEIEAKEMEPKSNNEESSYDHVRSDSSMSKNNINPECDIYCNEECVSGNSSVKVYKSLAERKSFENESSTVPVQKENTSPMLQEDTKTLEEKDNFQVILEKNDDLSWKKLSRDEALFFECCSLLKESDTSRKQTKMPDAYKSVPKTSKYPSDKSDMVSSLDAEVTGSYNNFTQESISNHDEPRSLQCENIINEPDSSTENSLNKNNVLEVNVPSPSELFSYECDKNNDFNNACELKKCDSIESIIESLSKDAEQTSAVNIPDSFIAISPESDKPENVDCLVYKEKESSLSLSSFVAEKHADCSEHDPYSAESLMARNNSDEFSENGDSVISNQDTVQHSIESLNKNIYLEKSTDYINQLNEFEDKFDKIKRKAREKAQAAQEAMAAVLTPRLHSKKSKKRNHCKSRRSGKQDAGFRSKSGKRLSKHGQNHKKKNNFTTAQKIHNKKVMTKGALKGFDGVKVSIPTQEINLHEILDTKSAELEFINDPENSMSDNNMTRSNFQNNDEESIKNTLDENIDVLTLTTNENKKPTNDKKKKSSQFNEKDRKEHISKKHLHDDDGNDKHQLDIYEFFDDDDENNVSDNFKFRTPVILSTKEKSAVSSSKRLADNFTNSLSHSEKNVIETQNEDSQISSLSFSDRDEFVYMSDDYIENNSEEETNLSSNSVERGINILKINRKHKKLSKAHKNVKKNAIMGKIFKNNAIRNDQKCLKETITENFSQESPVNAHTDMDQLFDSLLEQNPIIGCESNMDDTSKNLAEEIDFYNEPDNEATESVDQRIPVAGASTYEYLSEDYETDDESRVNARIRQRKIVPRLKARSTDDESSVNVPSKLILIHSEKGHYNKSERRPDMDFYKDNIGVASRKSQRKCTTGKQNVLVESWSSESDFEDFRQFEEYSSIPRSQRHHRRPRRSGRHRPTDEPKLLSDMTNDKIESDVPDQNSEVTDSTEPKKMVDYTLNNEEKLDNVQYSSKKRKKRRSIHVNQLRIQQKTLRLASGLHQSRRVSFNPLNHASKVQGSRRRRRQSQKPFDYDDEFKPARIAEPLAAQRRNKRAASEMLYYWSSSSDDDVSYTAVDTSSREPEPIEQHGWIVGDSHKKLVTMLAHAKGRKLDDNTSVKEKKPRPSV